MEGGEIYLDWTRLEEVIEEVMMVMMMMIFVTEMYIQREGEGE